MVRGLLTSIATSSISTLLRGLDSQWKYWSGIAWISSALQQRVDGMAVVDLASVTARLSTYVSFPDAGLVGGILYDTASARPVETASLADVASLDDLISSAFGGEPQSSSSSKLDVFKIMVMSLDDTELQVLEVYGRCLSIFPNPPVIFQSSLNSKSLWFRR